MFNISLNSSLSFRKSRTNAHTILHTNTHSHTLFHNITRTTRQTQKQTHMRLGGWLVLIGKMINGAGWSWSKLYISFYNLDHATEWERSSHTDRDKNESRVITRNVQIKKPIFWCQVCDQRNFSRGPFDQLLTLVNI